MANRGMEKRLTLIGDVYEKGEANGSWQIAGVGDVFMYGYPYANHEQEHRDLRRRLSETQAREG